VFAAEYVKDWNATQAAQRAGYSAKTAYSQGQRLLKNVEVRAEIDRLSADIADQNDVKVREIIGGLRRIAFAPEDARVSNSDRLRALELLGKYKAMFTDSTNITDTVKQRELDAAEQAEASELGWLYGLAEGMVQHIGQPKCVAIMKVDVKPEETQEKAEKVG
jgi:phage terminase small subunit